jgi:hypothetical protein
MSRKTRRVAIVGSTSFPLDAALMAEVVDVLRGLGDNVALLTRGSDGFDEFITHVAPLLEMRCFTYPSAGGPDNWKRDGELAGDADEVIAFITRAELDRGDMTGTLHVTERALDKKKPTKLYTEVDGHLVYAGANDAERP